MSFNCFIKTVIKDGDIGKDTRYIPTLFILYWTRHWPVIQKFLSSGKAWQLIDRLLKIRLRATNKYRNLKRYHTLYDKERNLYNFSRSCNKQSKLENDSHRTDGTCLYILYLFKKIQDDRFLILHRCSNIED